MIIEVHGDIRDHRGLVITAIGKILVIRVVTTITIAVKDQITSIKGTNNLTIFIKEIEVRMPSIKRDRMIGETLSKGERGKLKGSLNSGVREIARGVPSTGDIRRKRGIKAGIKAMTVVGQENIGKK